jgi:hypothetical protein
MKEKQGNRKLQVSHIYIYHQLMTGVVNRGSHIIAVYSNSDMQQLLDNSDGHIVNCRQYRFVSIPL